jgi:hypothetical protein
MKNQVFFGQARDKGEDSIRSGHQQQLYLVNITSLFPKLGLPRRHAQQKTPLLCKDHSSHAKVGELFFG